MLTSSDEVSGYNTDWLRTVRGQTRCVLRPRDTQEVSFSLKKINNISFIVTFLLLAVNKIFKLIHLHLFRCPHYWHTVGLEVLQFAPRCFSKLPKISLKFKTCLETPSLTKSWVIPSTLLYYISLLSGYGNLDNQCNAKTQ